MMKPDRRLAGIAVVVIAAHAALFQVGPSLMRPAAAARATQAFTTRTIVERPAPVQASAPTAVTRKESSVPPPRVPKAPPKREEPAPLPPGDNTAAPATPQPEITQPQALPSGVEVAAAGSTAPEPTPAPQSFAIPDSARLHYDVIAETRFGISVSSSAQLTWKHDGTHYEAVMEAGGGLLPSYVQRSSGLITPEGLAPLRFSDKRRSEQATHFVREQGKLVFSNNKPEAAIAPGMQDRLSVIVQLAAMVGGAPAKYPPGSSITVPTASISEAENWVFTVEGEEDLQLPGGRVRGLKLQRVPRREYDVKVELWLAPRMDYAPVRVRLTNPNGDSVDQRWSATDRG